jgi:hypothetical protein
MSWKEILKEELVEVEPKELKRTQYPKEEIARTLRRDMNESKMHRAINHFVPILEEYAYKDKSRASRYRKIAQKLRDIGLEIRQMVTEYE